MNDDNTPQQMAMQQLQGSGAGQVSELVKRLRAEGKNAFHQKYSLGMFKLCDEAADRIVALETALRTYEITFKRISEEGNRIEALEAALRFYADPKNYSDDYWKGIWKTAAAALAEGQDK